MRLLQRASLTSRLAASALAGLIVLHGLYAGLVLHAPAAVTAAFVVLALAIGALGALACRPTPGAGAEAEALTDNLTGLRNHRAFQEDLKRELHAAVTSGAPLSIAILDIDDFKALNDGSGHLAGDRVLVRAARHLEAGSPKATAYRVGGDEFALIYPQTPIVIAAIYTEGVREQLCADVGVSVTAGIATTAATDDPDAIVEQAHAALYEGKRSGRDTVVTFDAVRDGESLLSPAKARALRAVIESGRLEVMFQPIWEIGGTVLGYEALTRPDPGYGFSSTQEMFDIAERQRRMPELDARCRDAIIAATRRLGPDGLIFINVSPQTLDMDRSFGVRLLEAVDREGIDPTRVVVELTERSLARVPVVVDEVRRLSKAGFRIALDDTGAGNAGLQLLTQMPLDFLKIDHMVTINALHDASARGVLAGIVAIANETGSYVIAEGIESPEALVFLREFAPRVRALQGFFLGVPSPGEISGDERTRAARLVLQSSAPRPVSR